MHSHPSIQPSCIQRSSDLLVEIADLAQLQCRLLVGDKLPSSFGVKMPRSVSILRAIQILRGDRLQETRASRTCARIFLFIQRIHDRFETALSLSRYALALRLQRFPGRAVGADQYCSSFLLLVMPRSMRCPENQPCKSSNHLTSIPATVPCCFLCWYFYQIISLISNI